MSDFKISGGVLMRYKGSDEYPIIPDGVTAIDSESFKNCEIKALKIPYGVKTIGDNAFADCDKLERIELPDTLEVIGDNAFSFCEKLEEIVIPDSVRKIGDSAFVYCESLKRVTLPNRLEEAENLFSNCPFEELILPDSVTSIFGLCYFCKKLKKVRLPRSLSEIGYQAFYGCFALEELENFSDRITEIDENAFYGCKRLPEDIKSAIEKLNDKAFEPAEDDLQTEDELEEERLAREAKEKGEEDSYPRVYDENSYRKEEKSGGVSKLLKTMTVPADKPLTESLPREERVYVEETGTKNTLVLRAIFNHMFPIALIWLLFDGGILVGMTVGGAFKDPMMLLILLFFAVHMIPIYMYIGLVVKSLHGITVTSSAVTDKGVYFKKSNVISYALLSDVKSAFAVGDRGKRRDVCVILHSGEKLTLTKLAAYEEFETRIKRLSEQARNS